MEPKKSSSLNPSSANTRPVTTAQPEVAFRLDTITYALDDPSGRASYTGQVRVESRVKSANEPKSLAQAAPSAILTAHGVGVLRFVDGSIYRGDFRDDRRFGSGVQRYADGRVYAGDWIEDQPHGRGRITHAAKTFEYGTQRRTLHGSGSLQHSRGGNAEKDQAYVYDGEFSSGRRHGRGMLLWPKKGAYYRGSFMANSIAGFGIHVADNGDYYAGEWANGQHDGYGCQYWSEKKCWFEGFYMNEGQALKRTGIYCWDKSIPDEPMEYTNLLLQSNSSGSLSMTPEVRPTSPLENRTQSPVTRSPSTSSISFSTTTRLTESPSGAIAQTDQSVKLALRSWMIQTDCTYSEYLQGVKQPIFEMNPRKADSFVEVVFRARKAAHDAIFCFNSTCTSNIHQVLELTKIAVQDANCAAEEADTAAKKGSSEKVEERIYTPAFNAEKIKMENVQSLSVRELRKVCERYNLAWFSPPIPGPSTQTTQSTVPSTPSTTLNFTFGQATPSNNPRVHIEDVVLVDRLGLVSTVEDYYKMLESQRIQAAVLNADSAAAAGKDAKDRSTSREKDRDAKDGDRPKSKTAVRASPAPKKKGTGKS